MHQTQISLFKNKEELTTSSRLFAIGDWLFLLKVLGAVYNFVSIWDQKVH
jgi:hypothetical protein